MKKYLAFTLLGLLSLNVMAQQPRQRQAPVRRQQQPVVDNFQPPQAEVYSFQTPNAMELQTRIDLGLQTGSLRFATETQTQRVEGLQTVFSASFGLSDLFSLGARGSYLNLTSGGTVASASRASATKSGLGDAEIFATAKIAPSSLLIYLSVVGGIKTGEFEYNTVSGESTNNSGGYYFEPKVAASMALGSVLIGGGASYRYHMSREIRYVSSAGSETLRLDPGNIIKAVLNTEIQTSYPFGAELEYIMEDRYEAISLLTPGGSRLPFGNTTTLAASLYMRFPINASFGQMDIVPWVSYLTNMTKKRGIANVAEDQMLVIMPRFQMTF